MKNRLNLSATLSVLCLALSSCGVGVVMGEPPAIDSLIYDKPAAPFSKAEAEKSASDLVQRLENLDRACNDSILHLYASTAQFYLGTKQSNGSIAWTSMDKNAYSAMVKKTYEVSKQLGKNGAPNFNATSTYGTPHFTVNKDGSVKVEMTSSIPGVSSGEIQWLIRDYGRPLGWQIAYERITMKASR